MLKLQFFIFIALLFFTPWSYGLTNEGQSPTRAPSPFVGKLTGVEISHARSEDITPENYPELISGFASPKKLKDLIELLSKSMNFKIIMDPKEGEKDINIIAYNPITVAEAYQIFLSALAIHNLAAVKSGPFLKIVNKETALRSNMEIYKRAQRAQTDQFITSIIKLKHVDPKELESKIKPFVEAQSVKSLIFFGNAVIISDYGANVNKVRTIIKSLDVPDQDFIFKVFPVKHAQAEKLKKIIDELLKTRQKGSAFRRYRPQRAGRQSTEEDSQDIQISGISSDERTNSVIVVGNQAGVNKVQELIKRLDYYKDPELEGGIYVYKVKHGNAEELAKTLTSVIAGEAKNIKSKSPKNLPPVAVSGGGSFPRAQLNMQEVSTIHSFQDVRIISEPKTNSLLIVSNKYNYDTILSILKKVDISRNQVFVKSIIMELNTDRSNDWQIANYFFPQDAGGIGRVGYGLTSLGELASVGSGATLLFPLSVWFKNWGLGNSKGLTDISQLISVGGGLPSEAKNTLLREGGLTIPSLSSFVKFLQSNVGGNILSTPQVMALDNTEATVSITDQIPIAGERVQTAAGSVSDLISSSISKVDVVTMLKITPRINPNVNSIQLAIEQNIDSILQSTTVPEELRKTNVAIKKRAITTSITLKDRETAVLGGLVRESSEKREAKIPLLGDIPLIGWLFKNSNTDKKKSHLIVFITPHIIRSAEDHKHLLSKKLKERMNFIRRFTGNEDPYKSLTQEMLHEEGSASRADDNLSHSSDSKVPSSPSSATDFENAPADFESDDVVEDNAIEPAIEPAPSVPMTEFESPSPGTTDSPDLRDSYAPPASPGDSEQPPPPPTRKQEEEEEEEPIRDDYYDEKEEGDDGPSELEGAGTEVEEEPQAEEEVIQNLTSDEI